MEEENLSTYEFFQVKKYGNYLKNDYPNLDEELENGLTEASDNAKATQRLELITILNR